MGAPEHTPGPWRVGPVDDTLISATVDRRAVAHTMGDYQDDADWPIMEANAHLIAAAPDFDAAATLALPVLRKYLEGDLNGGCLFDADGKPNRSTLDFDFLPLVEACEAAIASLEAAIAKARGLTERTKGSSQ